MRCKIPVADLSQKLDSTVCRYKKEPVWVRVRGNGSLNLHRMTDTDREHFVNIKPSDPDFDVSSPPLGYVQHGNKVYYLSRIPLRRVKQGLDFRAVSARELGEKEDARGRIHVSTLILTQEFHNAVLGIFPSLGDAIKMLRKIYAADGEARAQIAISRHIAMGINPMGIIDVHYKGRFVGWMQPDKMTVHVPKSDMSWVISKFLSHELDWEVD